MDADAELRLELRREFGEFLDADYGTETGEGKYVRRIADLMKDYAQTKRARLDIDLQGEI